MNRSRVVIMERKGIDEPRKDPNFPCRAAEMGLFSSGWSQSYAIDIDYPLLAPQQLLVLAPEFI